MSDEGIAKNMKKGKGVINKGKGKTPFRVVGSLETDADHPLFEEQKRGPGRPKKQDQPFRVVGPSAEEEQA